MEVVLSNGFCELNVDEMNDIEGGAWKWYDYALTVLFPVHGLRKIVYADLRNCYAIGYAEGSAK